MILLALLGCGQPVPIAGCRDHPCETLSEYALEGVPIEPNAPLWSDHAVKRRSIVLPPGTTIGFVDGLDHGAPEDWDLPVGSVVTKEFSFPADLRDPDSPLTRIETRLLVREAEGWQGHVFLWNGAEAYREVAGARVPVSFVDEAGEELAFEYVVPNTNQCASCHERSDESHLLGVVTHQLNGPVVRDGEVVDQVAWLAAQGLFSEEPPPAAELPALLHPFGDGPVAPRARAYLHANCAHCHRPGGGAANTGLVLLAWEEDPIDYGVCRGPISAGAGTGGLYVDVEPGEPDESILLYRMSVTDPEIKMPELPNRLPDEDGIALVRQWIAEMDLPPCE